MVVLAGGGGAWMDGDEKQLSFLSPHVLFNRTIILHGFSPLQMMMKVKQRVRSLFFWSLRSAQ